MKRLLARFMLDWVRADLIIARSAPIWNMDYIESLRREEVRWEKESK